MKKYLCPQCGKKFIDFGNTAALGVVLECPNCENTIGGNDLNSSLIEDDELFSKNKLLEKMKESDEALGNLIKAIDNQMGINDETYEKMGRALVESYLNDDVDGVLKALTGWTMDSLLALMDKVPCDERDEAVAEQPRFHRGPCFPGQC